MEALLEILLQFFFEFFLQIIAEVLSEVGMQSMRQVFQRKEVQNPWLAGTGHFLLGAAIGGISLLFFHHALLHRPTWRIVNLLVTPLLAGLTMTAVGSLRRKKGQDLIRLDRFGYGFLFAFGMALVRFIYEMK